MKIPWLRVVQVTLALVVLAGIAGLVAPVIDAGRFRAALDNSLRETLGRPVQFGEVRYQVFPMPGLSARDLVIPDDAACGLEPLAYVGELQAGVRFLSLFSGKLELDSVRLVEASVNVSRCDGGGWNFSRVLERMARDVQRTGSSPSVKIRDSRVNFRAGTLKSVYFLNTVDLDLDPPGAPGGALRWHYEASPARTDRAEQGFGRAVGSGRWTLDPKGQGQFQVDVELERSAIAELLTLLTGSDLGVQGRFRSRATLDGTLDNMNVRGSVELEGVENHALFTQLSNNYSLAFSGHLDLLNQGLEIRTDKPQDKRPALPLELRLACRRMLIDPRWEAALEFSDIQAPALVDIARRLGALIPDGLKIEGLVAGSLSYTQMEPVQGDVTVRNARVSLRESTPLEAAEAHIKLRGTELDIEPAQVSAAGTPPVELTGHWDMASDSLAFTVKGERIRLAELRGALGRLNHVAMPTLVRACGDGEMDATLHYERPADKPETAGWTGNALLRQTHCAVEGLAGAVTVESARAVIQKDGWTVRQATGEFGKTKWSADLTAPAGPRPERLALTIETLDGADVDNLLHSALTPPRGFLDRTLRRRPQAPVWLRGRKLEGTVRVGELRVSDQRFTDIASKLFWRGGLIELPDMVARADSAQFSGRLTAQLGGETPDYRLRGRVDGFATQAGVFDADVDLALNQLTAPLSSVLRGTAQITGRDIDLGDEKAHLFNACLDYDGARAPARLEIGCLDVQANGETFTGQGTGSADGRLTLDLTSPRRTLRLSGHWPPLQFGSDAR